MRNVISGVTAPKSTKLLYDIAASQLVSMPYCIPFQNVIANTGGGQIRRLQKAPHINWLPQQHPLSDLKTNVRLIIRAHMFIKDKQLVETGCACSEIIGRICPFLQYFFQKSTKISKRFSGITTPNITKSVHCVATFNMLLRCQLAFRYSNPFRNGSATKELFPRKTPILLI